MLTQEDWNIVLFAGMERTSHWAALYFVALMTFGNYVLFNLLVAILVEGFSNQVSLQKQTAAIVVQLGLLLFTKITLRLRTLKSTKC